MSDVSALLPLGTLALYAEPVPLTFRDWLARPEFQYPLAFGAFLLLALLIYRLPDILAWRRARHKEVLLPIELESCMVGSAPVIIDLRPEMEFYGAKGHIRGAYNVPIELLSRRIEELAKDKRHLVVLVDESDRVSHRAAPILQASGYLWVRVLRGGMRSWRNGNLPVNVSVRKG